MLPDDPRRPPKPTGVRVRLPDDTERLVPIEFVGMVGGIYRWDAWVPATLRVVAVLMDMLPPHTEVVLHYATDNGEQGKPISSPRPEPIP